MCCPLRCFDEVASRGLWRSTKTPLHERYPRRHVHHAGRVGSPRSSPVWTPGCSPHLKRLPSATARCHSGPDPEQEEAGPVPPGLAETWDHLVAQEPHFYTAPLAQVPVLLWEGTATCTQEKKTTALPLKLKMRTNRPRILSTEGFPWHSTFCKGNRKSLSAGDTKW